MLMAGKVGNIEQVRSALQGITGVTPSPDRNDGCEWYMLIVRPNYELDAVDGLRRQKLRAYWPNYERTVPSRRIVAGRQTRKVIRVSILPYVLSPCDEEPGFTSKIERVVAVLDIVRTYSGSPLLLRQPDIDIIRRIDVGMNTPKPEAASHNFKAGDKVRFLDDLIRHWPPGVVNKVSREGRISVEVNMMGRKVPITVFPHQIERM
jgi:transcription antitermination factor NusG